MASHEAARRAVELGYRYVDVMPAGIQGWTQAGKLVERGTGSVAR